MTSRVITGESEGYFSPGGSGEGPRFTGVLDRDLFASRSDLASGVDSLFRPNLQGGLNVRIVVQGLDVVANHAAVVDVMIPGAIGIAHQVTGRLTVEQARRSMLEDFGRPPIDTGNTLRSIHARLETTPDLIITDVGPTTFYAPFIEFGLARHFTYGPRPFMTLAFYAVLPQHLEALREIAKVASVPRAKVTGPHYGPPVNSFLQRFRAFLYTAEKQAGNVRAYGGISGLSGPRSTALGLARGLGDLQSVMRNAVGARFVRRLEGKVTGRLIGIGSHTLFARHTIATRITGAERTYNLWAGKYMSRFIGQNKLFGGG